MKRMTRGVILAIPILLLGFGLNADTLVLRNGQRIDGQLISVRDGVVEFQEGRLFSGGRTVRLSRDEVLGIEFDRNDRNPPPAQRDSVQGHRPAGLRERQVTVAANVPWTDSDIVVQSGQEVYFEASGEIRWGPNRNGGPNGEPNSPNNPNRPIPNRPGGSLIGRVGENSRDYFFIGGDRSPIRMRSSGRLFLGINDDVLQDNAGTFRVVVYY